MPSAVSERRNGLTLIDHVDKAVNGEVGALPRRTRKKPEGDKANGVQMGVDMTQQFAGNFAGCVGADGLKSGMDYLGIIVRGGGGD